MVKGWELGSHILVCHRPNMKKIYIISKSLNVAF